MAHAVRVRRAGACAPREQSPGYGIFEFEFEYFRKLKIGGYFEKFVLDAHQGVLGVTVTNCASSAWAALARVDATRLRITVGDYGRGLR